jgi:hypothetical protein
MSEEAIEKQTRFAQPASGSSMKKMRRSVPVKHNFNPGPAVLPAEVLNKL